MNPRLRRGLAVALVSVGLGTVTAGLSQRDVGDDFALSATSSAADLGTLRITPGSGLDTTRSSITTTSTGATKGCPGTTSYVQATATGPGGWSSGLLVLGTTDQDFSTSTDFTIALSDTWIGIAKSNSTTISPGAYTVRLSCVDITTTVTYGTFTGSLTFADATHYTAAGATATPTPTPTASASGSPSASPSGSASASPSASATPSVSGSARPSATPSASASPTPVATSSPSPSPAATTGPVTLEVYDGSGAKLATSPTLAPGQQVSVVAGGFAPSAAVSVTLHSTPRSLGRVQADGVGTLSYPFTVPSDLPSGAHVLRLSSGTVSADFAFTVRRSEPAALVSAGGSTAAAGGSGSSLPMTGVDTVPLLLLGGALVGAGVLVLWRGGPAPAAASGPAVAQVRGGRHARP